MIEHTSMSWSVSVSELQKKKKFVKFRVLSSLFIKTWAVLNLQSTKTEQCFARRRTLVKMSDTKQWYSKILAK